MRTIAKLAIGAAMACGAAVAATAPAAAQVSFGIGVGPAYPYAAPVAPAYSCYDAYGNYLYSYPYCTAYPAYVAPPVVAPYFGIGIGGGWGWGGHERFEHGGFRGGRFEGGHMAMGGHFGGGGHRRG
ncbi:MAG TPA: hypothetical protein VFW28_10935 [Micropepsaceae bacterium]|nr:hypothetical protein [Micropepsaceae bacterium]